MDNDLREIERALAASPDDEGLRHRFRLAVVRSGQPERALPIEKGDQISVTESENPWINGTWVGEVVEVLKDGDMNVKPITTATADYRVEPSPEYFATGLYITKDDAAKAVITRPRLT